MKATAELQVVPIGTGVSVRNDITRVVELLQGRGFILETHASGTNIEGELAEILAAVEQIHELLHRSGSIRLLSYLKLETRTDKPPTLAGKRL
jgi:uncharacterized protein (TIGR00106 family)